MHQALCKKNRLFIRKNYFNDNDFATDFYIREQHNTRINVSGIFIYLHVDEALADLELESPGVRIPDSF